MRFALIDVKKAQKVAAGSKTTKEKNTIANELKIITAPDEVYNVWADLIAAHAQGELMDAESGKRFKIWESGSRNRGSSPRSSSSGWGTPTMRS